MTKVILINRQRGASLLEILVSLSIGLILLMVLASLMVVASNSSKQRSTSELLDETARQVFSRLETDLYRSGYVDVFANDTTMLAALNGSSVAALSRYARLRAGITDPNRATLIGHLSNGRLQLIVGCNVAFVGDVAGANPPVCPLGAPSTRQALQISYQAVRSSDTATGRFPALSTHAQEGASQSGTALTCTSQTATIEDPVVINRYWARPEAGATQSSLYCQSAITGLAQVTATGSTAREQPATLGVEQLVFRYLITPTDNTPNQERPNLETTESGRSVTQYLNADAVMAHDLRWAGVVGVEICLIVAAEPFDGSREGDVPAVQPVTPNCLRDGNSTAADAPWAADIQRNAGDTRIFRRYVRTINLPNSINL